MIYEFRHIPKVGIWRNSIFKAGLWGLMGRFAPRRSEARPQNQSQLGLLLLGYRAGGRGSVGIGEGIYGTVEVGDGAGVGGPLEPEGIAGKPIVHGDG